MKRSGIPAVVASLFALVLTVTIGVDAQSGAGKGKAAKSAVPRTADGHPDLSGVWWRGADVGGKGFTAGNAPTTKGGPPPTTFSGLYTPAAQAKAKTLSDKDDPTLRCIPTAFGTLNVSMFDVGAVGQIVQTPKFLFFLAETYHGYQTVPIDGRPHRDDAPPSYRGDSIGHWEGDTLVVDKNNFTDDTWITAEGRVSPHSDELHIVERYTRTDANTLVIEATLEDPKMLREPWKVPTQTLVLAPFDRLLDLSCGTETQSLMEGAQKQK